MHINRRGVCDVEVVKIEMLSCELLVALLTLWPWRKAGAPLSTNFKPISNPATFGNYRRLPVSPVTYIWRWTHNSMLGRIHMFYTLHNLSCERTIIHNIVVRAQSKQITDHDLLLFA